MNRSEFQQQGFTLNELLVVIAIIANLGRVVFASGRPKKERRDLDQSIEAATK